jgi:tetratricopeptide (TPR) repeat protein
MSLQGDLSTLDLPGLFQNLEGARKSGLLTIQDGESASQLYFHEGKLSLIAFPGRASLIDYLVAAGDLDAERVQEAQRRRRRGKSLGETLVELGALRREALLALASARLTDEACELLGAGSGRFEFLQGEIPRGVFDPEERALGMALAVSPLLLEAARRSDHWSLVRERIPSDSAHYVLARTPKTPGDPRKKALLERIVPLLDGAHSVSEIVARFPHQRLEAFELLAELAGGQAIRLAASTDLNRMIQELARYDKKRAWSMLQRGLETSPHNLSLLCTKVLLAEKLGDLEQATEALKTVVHLRLEAGESQAARADLERLRVLDADDPFAWEKSFELALADGHTKEVLQLGKRLVALYRKPGLHRRAAAVLERLVEAQGASFELVRELARTRVEAGDVEAALKGLEKYGATLVARESYPLARRVYEEILVIDPGREGARDTLAEIQSGALAQRRARWRRLWRRALVCVLVLGLLPWIGYEALARRAYDAALASVVREGLLGAGRYAEAAERFEEVRARYGWSTVAHFELGHRIDELHALTAPRAPR